MTDSNVPRTAEPCDESASDRIRLDAAARDSGADMAFP